MIEFTVHGFKELDELLKKLPEDFQIKAGWKATIEGAKIVRDLAKAFVPEASKPHYWYPYRGTRRGGVKRKGRERAARGTAHRIEITPGLIRRSIKCIRKRQYNKGIMQYMIGPIGPRGLGKQAVDPFYWKWIEYGKRGYPAQKFLRNAFDDAESSVINTMRSALSDYIVKANKKITKVDKKTGYAYRLPV